MVRSRQGIIPTALGERILEEANAIVLAERRINALTDNLKRGYEAELRVGCTPTLSLHALPQPVADFARDNPGVRLDMRQAHSGLLAEMLAGGLVDVVLGPPEIAARLPAAQSHPLFKSQMVILASRYHPLAGRGAVTLTDLDAARWALHQPGTGIRQAADLLLRRIGVSDRVQANALPSNMILSLLRMGDHLAVVPRYVLRNDSMAGDLVKIDSGTATVSLGHAAIWTGAKPSAAIARFVTHMTAALAPLDDA
jgi:DNA-binding transcriptional LysR family regulator